MLISQQLPYHDQGSEQAVSDLTQRDAANTLALPTGDVKIANVPPRPPLMLRLLSCTAMLALAACADNGNITTQSTLVDPNSLDAGTALASADHGTEADSLDSAWWTAFGDEQLNQLVAHALDGSPTLRIAQARVRQAQAAASIAKASTLPTLQGDAELIRNHFTEDEFIPPPYAGNSYWDNKILIEASYGLDLWGKDRDLHEAALDNERAAQAEALAARLSLQTAVVRSYLQLALAYAQQDVTLAILAQQQQILDITQKRYRAGIGTQLDVSEAETPLPTTRAQLEQIREAIAQEGIRLAALTGNGPGAGEHITRPALDIARILPLPDAIPAHWLARRPDLSAQRWRIEAASKNIKAARARFYPDIDIKAFAGFQSLDFDQLLKSSSALTGIGPAITLPIFNGGKLRAQLGANTAAYDIAVESYNETLINALAQVSGRITSIRSLDVQLDNTQQALASAQKAYKLALSGYRAGLTEYINVLSTQSHLFDEQRRIAQLQVARLDAHATLIEALGGGVSKAAP